MTTAVPDLTQDSHERLMPQITGYHHLNVTVTDVARSAAWYTEVLGFTTVKEFERDGYIKVVMAHPGSRTMFGLTGHGARALCADLVTIGFLQVQFVGADTQHLGEPPLITGVGVEGREARCRPARRRRPESPPAHEPTATPSGARQVRAGRSPTWSRGSWRGLLRPSRGPNRSA